MFILRAHPHTHSRLHIMMALFPISLEIFLPLLYVFMLFSQKWKKNQEPKSYTQREKMVMPDVICVPNNNKAIQHLNMCFSPPRLCIPDCEVWRSVVFRCLLSSPSTNFRHYLIEKGFSAFFRVCFPNISTTFCALMMPFSRQRAGKGEGWCSRAHYCSYYYSFLSLLTRRRRSSNKGEWFTGREEKCSGETDFLPSNPRICVPCRCVFSYALMMMTWE